MGDVWLELLRLKRLKSANKEGESRQQLGEECKSNTVLSYLVMRPHGLFRIWLSIVGASFIAHDVLLFPIQQVFFRNTESWPLERAVAICSLCFWTLDVPMQFFIGFYFGGVVEMRPAYCARHYLRTWFAPDMLTVLLEWATLAMEH